MSAAKAEGSDAPSGGFSTKKLIVILLLVLGVVGIGVGALVVVMNKRAAAHAAAAEEDGGSEEVAHAPSPKKKKKKKEVSQNPVFLPLDPFVVNLTDREQDRYAQIGITLEIDDPKVGEQMKTVMPAIRNGILLTLAHKHSRELLQREGKEKLAEEIMRDAVRPLGFEDAEDGPVRAVLFSTFIIQ